MKKWITIHLLLLSIVQSLTAQPYGLEVRVPNTSLLLTSSAPTEIELQRVFSKISFSKPLFLTHAGDGSDRVFVVQNDGQIFVFPNDDNVSGKKTFLDLRDRVNSGGEKGLLGLAFHPAYKSNGKFYVNYTTGNLYTHISEFTVSADPDAGDPGSERLLFEVYQPEDNHNGGMIAFGPDGFLYIGLGDGGGGGDPYRNGQNPKTPLAAILRIDVNGTQDTLQYKIPADNPFADATDGTRREIWAYGLRNPWRFSFDREKGTLWCGDVGQGKWEEVDIIEKGKNYGWNIMEGFHCYSSATCNTDGLALPIVEYSHDLGYSITGGYVYRGSQIDNFAGTYLYGDYGTRQIWALNYENGQVLKNEIIAESPASISSFGEDEAGELYIVGYNGAIYKIKQKAGGGVVSNIPDSISTSGLYSDIAAKTISPGIIPYTVNAPLWSDGAVKERFIALPELTQMNFHETGAWSFPEGAVMVKNFSVELETGNPESQKMIETRFLVKRTGQDGWNGYSYKWNESQTEALLLDSSSTRVLTIQGPQGQYEYNYYFPTRTECLKCHTPVAGYVLGLTTAQTNGEFTYPNGVTDHQLRSLNHISMFSSDIGEDYSNFPQLPDPYGDEASLEERARAYLDANCAQCHQPNGTGIVDMDLRFSVSQAAANIIDIDPEQSDLGITGAKRIKSGAPDSSVIYLRMLRSDEARMPPLAVSVPDTAAIKLIADWIISLKPTAIGSTSGKLPLEFQVRAYPNPFNPQTRISFDLPQDAYIRIDIYNVQGVLVTTLSDTVWKAGSHQVLWDGQNAEGQILASGLYFYRLTALLQTQLLQKTGKLLLVK